MLARHPCLRYRSTSSSSGSLYAIGEGWTGAMGTGKLDEPIVTGHFDEEHELDAPAVMKLPTGSDKSLDVQSIAVGWGHTAIVANQKLYVTGRPHDFSSLLRLRRLPVWLRNYSVRQTLKSTMGGKDQQDAFSDAGVDPTSLVGRLVSWLSETFQLDEVEDWEVARQQSLMPQLTRVELPSVDGEPLIPASVTGSAGFTAVLTTDGRLYTFGLNGYGQCGIGKTSNNVWQPQPVMGLSFDFAFGGPRSEMEASYPIKSVALGLQHVVCVNTKGEMFAFGKGDRGQLGQEIVMSESHSALPIRKVLRLGDLRAAEDGSSLNVKPTYEAIGRIEQVAAGMIHSAALDEHNQVLLWGKNILPKSFVEEDDPKSLAADARLPVIVEGLPKDLRVEQIACGTHHTAILLEDGSVWAMGISSDTKVPIHSPVMLIPPGVVERPIRQFAAHMDRTTIVAGSDKEPQVLQVHLWEDPELQEYALFTPAWVDRLLEEEPNLRIREVHRGWIHTVVVTD